MEAAEAAVIQSNKNQTLAAQMLEQEEEIINSNFAAAVQDMVANGWEEVVARQALLMQWTLDQRKATGQNITLSNETLSSIKPTLKAPKEKATKAPAVATKVP